MVLAPGLWMPGAAMALLAARLRARGYAPQRLLLPRRARRYEANVERLARFARALAGAAHFVGHSLGGVLILDMLNRHPEVRARARRCCSARRCAAASPGGASAGAASGAG